MEQELPIYTKEELALRNGVDTEEIWIAYKGKIYDVTKSRFFRDGKHYEHNTGMNLTAEMAKAPHGKSVFIMFEPIGLLKEE